MNFFVDPKIFETFPGVEVGVVVAKEIDNEKPNDEIVKLLRVEEAHQARLLAGVELGALPEIAAWRQIYKRFGSKPQEYRSSVESLLRRARAGNKPLPQINPLVDLYNYLSLKYHLPIGAEDLDKAKGDIVLGFSDGTEKGIPLGSTIEETCYAGEVIYKDTEGFVCRRWNWREADRTKISEYTTNPILVLEKVPAVSDNTFKQALDQAEALIQAHLGGRTQRFLLNKANAYPIKISI